MDDAERPSVILAHTVKGYRLGPVGEALNVAHKVKTLDADALRAFRDRLGVPIGEDDVGDAPLVRPAEDSPEIEYLRARRQKLGGPAPRRRVRAAPLESPPATAFERWMDGTGEREVTTTVALVRLLSHLLNDETLGPLLVPIVPDEARTFGIEALFPKIGIYCPGGQRYEPVDADTLQPHAERADGQLLEEGISEAGAMASFIAAGTAYAHRGLNMIPLYFFYSMFGFQRVGDLIWAAGDARARGFLIGCTSGRTTLNGEGLQHQDGHSHLLAHSFPAVRAYDPAFAYEVATLVRAGIERMFVEGHDETWYLTVANAPYRHPPRPEGAEEGIVRGLYRVRASQKNGEVRRAQLLASGPIVVEALEAQRMLEEDYGLTADVWSVTSWQQLYRDAVACERHDRLRPDADARVPWLAQCLGEDPGVIVGVSDFVKALPHALARWMPGPLVALGTDGFGRSDSRPALRRFFQNDARHIAHAALSGLARAGRYPMASVLRAADELGVDAEARPPFVAGEGER